MKYMLFLLLFVGCSSPDKMEQREQYRKMHVETLSDTVEYYRDTRTNLCFAGIAIGYQWGSLTNVPCTTEVDKIAHLFTSER
jgi:hypothetical protein